LTVIVTDNIKSSFNIYKIVIVYILTLVFP